MSSGAGACFAKTDTMSWCPCTPDCCQYSEKIWEMDLCVEEVEASWNSTEWRAQLLQYYCYSMHFHVTEINMCVFLCTEKL